MIVIGDPRRVRVKWYQWRIRANLLLPMAMFVWLAAGFMDDFARHPWLSLIFGGPFLVIAFLFARQVWRERHPLRTEERGSADPVK